MTNPRSHSHWPIGKARRLYSSRQNHGITSPGMRACGEEAKARPVMQFVRCRIQPGVMRYRVPSFCHPLEEVRGGPWMDPTVVTGTATGRDELRRLQNIRDRLRGPRLIQPLEVCTELKMSSLPFTGRGSTSHSARSSSPSCAKRLGWRPLCRLVTKPNIQCRHCGIRYSAFSIDQW